MSAAHPSIVESPLPPPVWQGCWPDESHTQAFAAALATALARWPGGHDAFMELHGDLGAGKTTLVRHLLRALGVSGRIKSPTYAVVEPHEGRVPGSGAVWPIWHFDFYRFDDPREWQDAGFRDVFAGPGLKLAEWPEKAAGVLPRADWVLHLHAQDESVRQVRIEAPSPRGQSWLRDWCAKPQGPAACSDAS